MACVPGGKAIVGSSHPNERPRHEVEVSTFYLDRYEATNAEYEACEAAGRCRKRDITPNFVPFLAPELPATPLTWRRAREFCVWAGKRLPTEAEWEKAARGGLEARTYPWGEEEPTCSRAQFQGCKPGMTRKGGSFPAGPYGIFDMAGNGYEWVEDWGTPCYQGCFQACGKDCMGLDPAGPCGGEPDCEPRKQRVLKGGSWWWGKDHLRGAYRRVEPPEDLHRFSVRCAATRPELSTFPPRALTRPRPRPARPGPPTQAQLEAFRSVVPDDDVLKLPLCGERKGTGACKDPHTYYASNELEPWVWRPYLTNLGGAFVGVGVTQTYSFAAEARSIWVFLLDYDPDVVRLHAALFALVAASPTRAELVARFERTAEDATATLLEGALARHPEGAAIVALYRRVRPVLLRSYQAELAPSAAAGTFGWLRTDEAYDHVRWLVAEGRIQSVRGNLLTPTTLPTIARSARALGVPVRVFYTSNADDLWELTQVYRDNVRALPFDGDSIALRTISKRSPKEPEWTYVVHGGLDEQEKLARGYRRISTFLADGHPAGKLVRVIGLPGGPAAPVDP